MLSDLGAGSGVALGLHTLAYVSIRQHTSAYVSIRQHTSAYVSIPEDCEVIRLAAGYDLAALADVC